MKPIPPGMTFREALQNGYRPIRTERYMALVRTLPCVICDAPPPSDPHHPHGVGYKGGATKAPDIWVIPLCRAHHEELHHDRVAWEEQYGPQFEYVAITFARLWCEGGISFAGEEF